MPCGVNNLCGVNILCGVLGHQLLPSDSLCFQQGHLMAYYAGYEDTPIHSKEHKERNMMDCCMITQIRPVTLMADTPENAFDVVCVDREWTFCAESKEEMQVWLQVQWIVYSVYCACFFLHQVCHLTPPPPSCCRVPSMRTSRSRLMMCSISK
jgi:hypothetical protein